MGRGGGEGGGLKFKIILFIRWGGGEWESRVSKVFSKNSNVKKDFFFWGGGMCGLGGLARDRDFLFPRIQI